MDVISYSEARGSLKSVMDRVVDDHAPVVVSRQRGRAVVMVSLDDWESIEETMYLLSTPNNTKQLMQGIEELNAGLGAERELISP